MRKSNIPHSPALRKRQKQQKILKGAGIFFATVLFLGFLVWGANHKSLIIINVTISGAEVTNPKLIENVVRDVLSGYYFYFFPKDHVSTDIKTLSHQDNVTD